MIRQFCKSFVHVLFFAVLVGIALASGAAAGGWSAGTAKVKITPTQPMWMSGYASRTKMATEKLTDLWAKVLVLRDASGNSLTLVSLDLVGVDRETSLGIRRGISARHGVDLASIALYSSHTHSGPVAGTTLISMYRLDENQHQTIADYTQWLVEQVGSAVDQAFQNFEPVEVFSGVGEATFAVNRRNNNEKEVPQLRAEGRLQGPVDHRVPVLSVRSSDGKLKAVVFGYACHATVLSGYQWSGDYPGFAQIQIEEQFPEAMAMFVAGAGADQNPLPRRKVEQARDYGKQLATAVSDVLGSATEPLTENLTATYAEIPLAYAHLPTRSELESTAQSSDFFEAGRAQKLLAQWDRDGELLSEYPYPIQIWQFGDGPIWINLGGEVVVDYSLSIQQKYGDRFWTAGYANDVMAYIPSRRVLQEGGYEGASAMVYYGLPSPWKVGVEQDIMSEIKHQLDRE